MSKKNNISFNDSENKKFIVNAISNLGLKYGIGDVFSDFVAMCAIALSYLDFTHRAEREKEYLRIINQVLHFLSKM